MLKVVLLVCGIAVTQFPYCYAEGNVQPIVIQIIKRGTIGRDLTDVEAVIKGAILMRNQDQSIQQKWINLQNAKYVNENVGEVIRTVQHSDFEEGDLFRYTFDDPGAFEIKTCPLKAITGFELLKNVFGLTYGTTKFTLYENGLSMELFGHLGAPPNQRENEFSVDMDNYPEMGIANVAMKFFGKVTHKFTSTFDGKVTGQKEIQGVITGVTMRKNRQNKDYLLIEYNDAVKEGPHPVNPEEKQCDVSLFEHEGKEFDKLARGFFALIHRKRSRMMEGSEKKVEEVRITSVTMKKGNEGDKENLIVIGYDDNLKQCIETVVLN